MINFSYEHYMNLLFHLECSDENIPSEIARRIVSHAIAPVITVTSTPELDKHIQDTYSIDSLYMLLRFFGGCVSDRDQASESKANAPHSSSSLTTTKTTRARSRSNSLFQRDSTQSQYIRFTRPLPDLVERHDKNDMLFDHHSLESYLRQYLELVEKFTFDSTSHQLLKKSLYHNFFSLAISSTTTLSPFESFNHPIMSLIALDITNSQSYEDAKGLLIKFKNLHNTIDKFPIYINTYDMLPVFLLCYNADSPEEVQQCEELSVKIKKQLFVESISLPLWKNSYQTEPFIKLHQPVMSSLDEMIYFLQSDEQNTLPIELTNTTYDMLEKLVYALLIPFMQRKIAFWEETVLQPKKSIFHGSKFLKKLMSRASTSSHQQQNILTKDHDGNEYFASSSPELLLRKLADWSIMLSDFKTGYATYEILSHDLELFPKYLASCLEWEAVSLLMGAQNIVTVKMMKNDISPLIDRALDAYDACAANTHLSNKKIGPTNESTSLEPVLSYETRCLILSSELFLSLSDTWTSTPYAINYLESILEESRLGPCSRIMIWERLSDCYDLRVDPRIKSKVEQVQKQDNLEEPADNEHRILNSQDDLNPSNIVSQGLTRKRKAAFFRLLAAKMWAEQGQWKQVKWCLDNITDIYSRVGLVNRDDLILTRLREEYNIAVSDSK
ncbi:hypothetical protein KAFR_0B05570 [Kazachstania africana CBS 2517]|uniref:Trafficking protein particle complex III-specific subunit 85 n=1 Tax=Kazachstania africana (strain ATCC 22294 / BCRC 22015 / CBS 2517 / CECT 1963 / NBRC 1671 / NRRL Y-8276) TaxID=1071382 RepID=H2AR52_KAZAF|nr:hypothetical protein KAFR_0B05570 [Kazachstania africana CBS 2517]CCF56852.1 hypothetical protein KAFR_0B05570 [Kazachstania africana CBS 2517]